MIYAEEANYWKSSMATVDSWLEKCKREIRAVDGKITREVTISEDGKTGYCLEFAFGEDAFKVLWPVLKCRKYDSKGVAERAARIQAATFMYHDIKAKCMVVKILGARRAFFGDMLLGDGRIAYQVASDELVKRSTTP